MRRFAATQYFGRFQSEAVCGATVAWPLAAQAQQPRNIPRLCFLTFHFTIPPKLRALGPGRTLPGRTFALAVSSIQRGAE
jgi:hypothetical protein